MDRSIYDDAYTHVFIDTSTNEPTRLVGFCMKKKHGGVQFQSITYQRINGMGNYAIHGRNMEEWDNCGTVTRFKH